ncbi:MULTISPECIES: CAP domain-containing protein [unclassified Clostridium]|uniref:CAP domain-containing protein n=1 Tax=unclassified Clostridium TaxID=2614128 RepID=UPI0002979E0B|nr:MULTISPECIES: CAP domain-containing protein [unclassified Clostridium]EKQ51553.1 MAG: Cysteine-rich secretory protein family [Clostridium sp. Maddingley MBC34-26]
MKKNLSRKIVTAVIAGTTMASFSSLGVSAATIDSNYNDYYNTIANNLLNSGWVMNNGNWNYFDNEGIKQTGVINVDGKTYCLNQSGELETGKVLVDNKTYTTNSDGQVIGNKAPVVDKKFDANNNVVNDSNKTSKVTNANDNLGTTNTGISKTTDNALTSANSVDVQGLPQLPAKYAVNVQAAAEQKILELMNQKRTEAGLQPLTIDNTLVKVARYKSDDMIQNNFFDHTNPDGTKWTNWLHDLGYTYTSAGENIAYNTNDPVELFTQWWNSPGHRANMMNSSYTKVGIGVLQGNGKYMGTQEFSN